MTHPFCFKYTTILTFIFLVHKSHYVIVRYIRPSYFSTISIEAQPEFVQRIPSNSGIYFDRVGKLKITTGQLNVITYIDISYVKTHLTNINEAIGTVRFLCQKSRDYPCENILSPLSTRFNDMKREYDSISHLIITRSKRSAWFGIVGTAFKHIFGTLDEKDALRYDTAIDSVQRDEKVLAKLMKENILITTSTLDAMKQNFNTLRDNENKLNNALDTILNTTNRLNNITTALVTTTKAQALFSSLESSMLALSFQLEDLTSAIILTSQNILHPSVITPTQLYQELTNNDRHLPRDTRIPVSLSLENIHVILNMSNVACYYFNNKLVFILQIPLAGTEDYHLYHNVALPVPHDVHKPNVYSLIVPSSTYTAISKDKMSFCNLSNLSKCKSINSEFFLCEISTVLITSDNPTCESELLTKTVNAIPARCVTQTIASELDVWESLSNNQWIFVQSRSSKVSIDCGTSNLNEIIVYGVGILNVPRGCVVYTKSTRLISTHNVINISIPIPHLDFNIINDSCCKLDIDKKHMPGNASPILLQNINLDSLSSINKNEKIFSDLNKIIEEKPLIIKYGTHFFSVYTIIVIIMIVYFSYKLYYCFTKSKPRIKSYFVKPTATDSVEMENVQREDSPIPTPRLREIV